MQGLAAREEYQYIEQVYRGEVWKSKAQLELKLVRGVKNNKMGFSSLAAKYQGNEQVQHSHPADW